MEVPAYRSQPTDPTNTISEVVDNVPVKDGKGGDPILGKSIMYNVGVDDWTVLPLLQI